MIRADVTFNIAIAVVGVAVAGFSIAGVSIAGVSAAGVSAAAVSAAGISAAGIDVPSGRSDLPALGTAVAADSPVTGINVTARVRTLDATGTLRVHAAAEPRSSVQTVTWSSGDTALATVDASGLVTGVRTGRVTITATSTSDPGKVGSIDLTVKCPAPRTVPRLARGDATWENWVVDPGCFDYVVSANLEHGDGVLTIQPGAVVGFAGDAGITIRRGGALSAVGTADRPILLTGTAKTRGHWRGLSFMDSGDAANRLDHVTIEYGGGRAASVSKPANLAVSHGSSAGRSRVRVSHTTLRESAGYGLFVRGKDAVTDFTGNVLTRNALGPAFVAPPAVGAFQDGNDFAGNDVDFVSIQTGGGINNIRSNATWRSTGVPYRVLAGAPNELTVEHQAVLRIEPGVDVRFGAGVSLSILHGSLLAAMGTAEKPVVLRGDGAKWRGIHVHDASAYLDHVVIGDAGSVRQPGARQPGAVTLTASNGGTSRVTFTSSVSNDGAPYGTVFTLGDTFASGCLAPVFIPPPHGMSDHCNEKGVVEPPGAKGNQKDRQ